MGSPFRSPNLGQQSRGNGPPAEAEVKPSELFRKLTDRARPHEIVPWMHNDDDGQPMGHFWLQVLTQSEIDDASIDAEKYVRRRLKERSVALGESEDATQINQEAWRDMFDSARMVEVIYRACRDKDDVRRPIWPSPDDIRKNVSNADIVHLINAYDQVQHRFGPLWRTLTAEEIESWIVLLEKGAEDAYGPLSVLAPSQLRQLIISMAYLLGTSQTGNGSPGSQSDDSNDESSQSQELPSQPTVSFHMDHEQPKE